MKMFVANCTNQVQDFIYRVVEKEGIRRQVIQIGEQIILSDDLSQPQIDGIIEQHARYGLVSVDDIDRTKPFVGLAYSIDKPIRREKLGRAMEHNRAVLIERGIEQRKEAAVAINEQMSGAVGGQQSGIGVKATEATVIEEKSGSAEFGAHDPVAETNRVERQGDGRGPKKK